MTTPNKRSLTITCSEGEEVTKKQHSCFIHSLIADTKRPKPLITWKRDPEAKAGDNAYLTNGLAEGTLMTIRGLTDKPGVEFTYSRHGKLIYTATETDGDVNCDMHLTHLLHKVTCAVTMAEAEQKPNTPAEPIQAIKPKKPAADRYCMKVGDVFRKVTADQLVDFILRKPTMLSIGVAEGSPEFARLEALIRATVLYIQNVKPRETAQLLQSFGLKSLVDGRLCGHLVTSPMAQTANAYMEFDEKFYSGLHPAEKVLKFAADIVINLLIGI